jgi:hypothetical protein
MSAIPDRLRALGAHQDVISWAAPFGDDWHALFLACPRADWLLGLAARLGAQRVLLVRAAASCCRVGLAYLPDSSAPVDAALQAAEAWSGDPEGTALCAAQSVHLQAFASSDDAVTDSVVQAALATLATIASPEAAAHAAACTAHAAVLASGDCAMTSALRFTQERCADLVRAVLQPAELARLAAAG